MTSPIATPIEAEGGGGTLGGIFHTAAWSFSHIVGGGHEKFPLFKRGGARKVLPCLEEGGHKKFRTCGFLMLCPHPFPYNLLL